jgi:hypothetical protein
MSPKEFLEMGEKKGWQMRAILKEVPKGSGRFMLLGFERVGRSRKAHEKFILKKPIWKDELSNEHAATQPRTDDPTAPAGGGAA